MSGFGRRSRLKEEFNFWPSFVDALSTLLIVVLFFLLLFVLAHFFLGRNLDSKNNEIVTLNQELMSLSNDLIVEKTLTQNLSFALDKVRSDLTKNEQKLITNLSEMAVLTQEIKALTARKEKLEKEAMQGQNDLESERKISDQAKTHIALLTQQIETMTLELKKLSSALDASEKISQEQNAQIIDLGKKLNRALAQKVSELASYRSDFFGQLRKILKNRDDIRIEGDRFVFQSELFFKTGSADLEPNGKKQLDVLAKTLLLIAKEIPPTIHWILRVDGHTDSIPIRNERFSSNWQLSSARAIAVVEYLMSQGVPANRLVAAGFGEFQPILLEKNKNAFRRNRRIEFKLTDR